MLIYPLPKRGAVRGIFDYQLKAMNQLEAQADSNLLYKDPQIHFFSTLPPRSAISFLYTLQRYREASRPSKWHLL